MNEERVDVMPRQHITFFFGPTMPRAHATRHTSSYVIKQPVSLFFAGRPAAGGLHGENLQVCVLTRCSVSTSVSAYYVRMPALMQL
jgi:hypothetical protein